MSIPFGAVFYALSLLLFVSNTSGQPRNNIVLIVADDLGWDDVSFHGSKQIYTPNIDALAMDGIILNDYYVEPLCTPSRSALLSGRQPDQIGMQHYVIRGDTPYGLPLDVKILPEYLKELNYSTHLVGKWHLGYFNVHYWPTRRGFDTFFGYNNGYSDYFDHTYLEDYWGFDLWENETSVAKEYIGQYSTTMFQERAIKIIKDHRSSQSPLFLMLSFQAVHTGNKYCPFQAPKQYVDRFSHIKDGKRRVHTAMLAAMDDAIGSVVKELEDKSMLDNTLIVFTTDNGGQSYGTRTNVEEGAASNWPLRGTKGNFWEGGIRGVGFLWSKQLPVANPINNNLMHLIDWLPTIYTAAGGDLKTLPDTIDGLSHWDLFRFSNVSRPLRKELPLIFDGPTIAYRYKNYKYLIGPTWQNQTIDRWYKPAGRDTESASFSRSIVDDILQRLGNRRARNYDNVTQVDCGGPHVNVRECNANISPCLFDLKKDPCEYYNIYGQHKKLANQIEYKINKYNRSVVEPVNKPPDPRCSPLHNDNIWGICY